MKKVLLFALLFLAMIGVGTVGATDVKIDSAAVLFNESTGYPFVWEGRTLVPLRATMEAFGAEVGWDGATQTATVMYDGDVVRCTIGEKRIYRNGVKIENDAASCISNGRTYLPIRVVLEAFGADVGWDGTAVIVETDYGKFVQKMENGGVNDVTVWTKWSNAVAAQDSGNYSAAIAQFTALAPNFIKLGDVSSAAMLYFRLGNCYSAVNDYKNAALAYRREAYYWGLVGGRTEEQIDANRRSGLINNKIRLYAKTDDVDAIKMSDFAKSNSGILLGAYAEHDEAVYNPYDPSMFYMDTFAGLVGKEHGGYLLYLPYGTPLSHYESHIQKAEQLGKTVQIALEPHNGIEEVADDGYLIQLASDMEGRSCDFVLRFAGEMNDTTCKWYTENFELYKEKFRIVANAFHTYAPSVPVVWSPNFYPAETMDFYYPGDEYVDFVGLSAYKIQQVETDPLKQGVDRSVYSDVMDKLVKLYGDRKTIIISEGAASYMDYDTGADITSFAVRHINEFYTYLPIRYPQVKMTYYFDSDREHWKFKLSGNQMVLDAYKAAIQGQTYTDVLTQGAFSAYIETANNVKLPAKQTDFASQVTYLYPEQVSYAVYYINGEEKAVASGMPYSASLDLSPYAGQKITLTVKAFGEAGLLVDTSVTVNVE